MSNDNTATELDEDLNSVSDPPSVDEPVVDAQESDAAPGKAPGPTVSTWLKATRWEITERRMRCERLRMQGLGMEAIAKILKVSTATVSNDLKVVKDENKSRITKFERDSFVGDGLSRFEELEKRAWAEYHNTHDPRLRFRALDLLRSIQSDKFDALISCGVLQPDQKPQEVQHKHTFQIDWSEEVRAKVARTLMEQALRTELAEPTPDDHLIEVVAEPVPSAVVSEEPK